MAQSAACRRVILWVAVLAAMTMGAESAIPCSTVLSSVSSCLGYIRGGGPLPGGCCDGVKSLNNAAKTTPDLQDVCRCIKTLAPGLGAKADLINSLPGKCHVNIPYKYSPSLDCSKVVR